MANKITLSEKANAIIQKHDTILASERDQKIFFDALMNPPGPNQKLRDAAERYKSMCRNEVFLLQVKA